MNFTEKAHFPVVLVIAACSVVASATEPPATINLNGKDAPVISKAVIPIPLEVFAALDKLGDQNWNDQLEEREFNPSPDLSRSALLFGLAISQGFIAVQAENATEVKRVGMAVERLASPLNVSRPVEARIKVIMEALDAKNWSGVKQEFDRTRQTVLDEMKTMRDEDLASLVALGGWLGGTGALSAILKDNYSPEASDLLNQAGLLAQIKDDFDQLPASMKEDEVFAKIGNTLTKLGELMNATNRGVFTLAQVSEIHSETHHLLDVIYQN